MTNVTDIVKAGNKLFILTFDGSLYYTNVWPLSSINCDIRVTSIRVTTANKIISIKGSFLTLYLITGTHLYTIMFDIFTMKPDYKGAISRKIDSPEMAYSLADPRLPYIGLENNIREVYIYYVYKNELCVYKIKEDSHTTVELPFKLLNISSMCTDNINIGDKKICILGNYLK